MLSILISDKYVQYIQGKAGKDARATISKCNEFVLENGAVEKGIVKNVDMLSNALGKIKEEAGNKEKHIRVLINPAAVVSKLMSVPPLSDNRIRKIIKEELKEFVNENNEYVYDYSILSSNDSEQKSLNVLCCACDKTIMEGYEKAFKNAELNVESIDLYQNGQMKLIDNMEILSNKTFVLVTLTNNDMGLAIYNVGNMAFYNRYNIVNRNNLGFISDVSRILSNAIQFAQSENLHNIEKIYFCGMTANEMSYCSNIATTIDIDVQLLPESAYINRSACRDYFLGEYIFTTGNLYNSKKKDLNLLSSKAADDLNTKKEVAGVGKALKYIIPLGLLVIVIAIYINVRLTNIGYNKRIETANEYLNSTAVLDARNQLEAIKSDTARYDAFKKKLSGINTFISTNYQMDRKQLDAIYNNSTGINIYSVKYTNSTSKIMIECSSASYKDAPEYVQRLRATNLFGDILYEGFVTQGGEYAFSVTMDIE